MPIPGHDDESEYDDEVLVKRIKKIKQVTKSRPKQMQVRSKKSVNAQAEKKQVVKKGSKTPVKSGQLSVFKHKKEHRSLKKHTRFVAMIDNFNDSQRQVIRDMVFRGFLHLQVTELPGDLCKWPVNIFDPCSVTLYISPDKRIEITPMNVHLPLALPIGGRKIEEFNSKKPKDAKYNKVLDV
ncbi:hypothetical protein Cgig2_017401 [Carnegiea gigantea]|uniref:Uncharacterized protein n=1 Tax=Carnegiea gigantea TaxID=171969 RepID=A0A9Q1Q9P8_9CARY|nr:hypothetical protein Cgig2_017401 [Carnegiea gigantea]